MAWFVRIVDEVEAVQWEPDPALGSFDSGAYWNKSIGYDRHGIAYTVTEVGLQTPRGFMRIEPGDWIVTRGSAKWIVEGRCFPSLYCSPTV